MVSRSTRVDARRTARREGAKRRSARIALAHEAALSHELHVPIHTTAPSVCEPIAALEESTKVLTCAPIFLSYLVRHAPNSSPPDTVLTAMRSMQLSPSGVRVAGCGRGRGAACRALPLLRASSAGRPPGGALAARARSASRGPRRVAAAESEGEPGAPPSRSEGLSLDDATSLLSSVESDLKRFRAFEAQNEAGISRLAGIVVQAPSAALPGQERPRGDAAALSPKQLARVWKARGAQARLFARAALHPNACSNAERPPAWLWLGAAGKAERAGRAGAAGGSHRGGAC